MKRPDYSRLVALDFTPSEAMLLAGLLEGVKRLRGEEELGHQVVVLIDDAVGRIRLQLRRIRWPEGQGRAPFPV